MKQTLQTFALISITFFQATTFAGGKSALLKALVDDPKVSMLSINSFEEMSKAYDIVDNRQRYFEYVGPGHKLRADQFRQIGVFEQSRDGLSGRIHDLTTNDDGTVTRTVFKIPSSHDKPYHTEIFQRDDTGISIRRNFDTLTADYNISESYKIVKIDDVPMRVQTGGTTIVGKEMVHIIPVDNSLSVRSTKGSSFYIGLLKVEGKYPGQIVGFRMDPNGRELTIQLAEGPDKITERYFRVSPSSPYVNEGSISFKDVGHMVLTPKEIKEAGFLASVKKLDSRVATGTAASTRGLQITK